MRMGGQSVHLLRHRKKYRSKFWPNLWRGVWHLIRLSAGETHDVKYFFPQKRWGGRKGNWVKQYSALLFRQTYVLNFLVRLTVFYSFSLDLPCTMKSSTFLAGGNLLRKRRMGLHQFCRSPRMVSIHIFGTKAYMNDSNNEKNLIFFIHVWKRPLLKFLEHFWETEN